MYNEAIKIDPKYTDAYNGKGSKYEYNYYKQETRLRVCKNINKRLKYMIRQS